MGLALALCLGWLAPVALGQPPPVEGPILEVPEARLPSPRVLVNPPSGESGPAYLPPLRPQLITLRQQQQQQPQRAEEALPPPTLLPAPEKRAKPLDEEAAILLGAARTAVKQGKYEQAIPFYERFFTIYGDDPQVREEFAGVLFTAGKLRQAAEQYQRLLAAQPENVPLRITLSDVHVAAHEFAQAIAQLQYALRLAPENLELVAKLGRVYVFDENIQAALALYDKHLAVLRPSDENVPKSYAPLLLDLGWVEEALPFLLARREGRPGDIDDLSNLVRAYARLDDRVKALQMLDELITRKPSLKQLQGLGEAVYEAGDYEVAGQVYARILRDQPANESALIGTARVAIDQYQFQQARQILESVRPSNEAGKKNLALAWATYRTQIGEYVEAKNIYQDVLCLDENDHTTRMTLAKLYEFIAEYEKAKAEYSKIPPTSPLARRARLGFAQCLYFQWKLSDALCVCQKLLAENSEFAAALALELRILGRGRQYDQAVLFGQKYMQSRNRNVSAVTTVAPALGQVLNDSNNHVEALKLYEWLLTRAVGRTTGNYYGLARAYAHLGQPERAQGVLTNLTTWVGNDFRVRMILAELFYNDRDNPRTIDMCQAVLKWDPQNLAALIRRGDAELRIASFTWRMQPVLQTAAAILALSPTNVRGLLLAARAQTTAQSYQPAVEFYSRLLAIYPNFQLALRERARALYADHRFGAGAAAYQSMLYPSADEWLQDQLTALVLKDPILQTSLSPYLQAHMPPQALAQEAVKAVTPVPGSDSQASVQRLVVDYEARTQEQLGARLEGQAKDLLGWRNYEAEPIFRDLLAVEPGNTEGLFGLSQDYGGLKQTQNALVPMGQLLQVDPQSRDGMVEMERASLELNPQVRFDFDYFHQNGRNGLAFIGRYKWGPTFLFPIGDENEFFGFAFNRVRYAPNGEPILDGNIFSVLAQKKFLMSRLLLSVRANYEQYPDRIHDRVTFNTNANYDVNDFFKVHMGPFLENVIETGQSMDQDIYRTGFNAGTDLRPMRKWALGLNWRYAHYSDHNDMNELYLYNDVNITLPPKQLKFAINIDHQTFAQQSIVPPGDNPNFLFGTIHPYFAPANFTYYEGRLEWYHWLSRDVFTYSNQCWYSLQYGLGWDSNFNNYNTFRAMLNWDIKPWLSVGADTRYMFSQVYKLQTALAYVVFRFPCCLSDLKIERLLHGYDDVPNCGPAGGWQAPVLAPAGATAPPAILPPPGLFSQPGLPVTGPQ